MTQTTTKPPRIVTDRTLPAAARYTWRLRPLGEIEHPRPRGPWTATDIRARGRAAFLPTLAKMLDELGLEDPSGALALHEDALAILSTPPPEPPASSSDPFVDAQAAAGYSIGIREFAARREAAAVAKYGEALRAAHELGDGWVVDLIAPAVADVLKRARRGVTLDLDARWTKLHELAKFLRDRGGAPRLSGARGVAEYTYARPDLVAEARWAGARELHEGGVAERRDGVWVRLVPKGGPAIGLTEILANADEWQPGCFTAGQVLEHARDWRGVPA